MYCSLSEQRLYKRTIKLQNYYIQQSVKYFIVKVRVVSYELQNGLFFKTIPNYNLKHRL
jgi:hypothetical protein